jgi:hypothetical protein
MSSVLRLYDVTSKGQKREIRAIALGATTVVATL